ncbi:MAG: hypothetical protein WC675_00915 [Patescibacteria group bacterium]|jgi:hypothetical protein
MGTLIVVVVALIVGAVLGFWAALKFVDKMRREYNNRNQFLYNCVQLRGAAEAMKELISIRNREGYCLITDGESFFLDRVLRDKNFDRTLIAHALEIFFLYIGRQNPLASSDLLYEKLARQTLEVLSEPEALTFASTVGIDHPEVKEKFRHELECLIASPTTKRVWGGRYYSDMSWNKEFVACLKACRNL